MFTFFNNRALLGDNVINIYLDIGKYCNKACLNRNIVGVDKETVKYIKTSPRKLVLLDPAICIDNDNASNCRTYYVNDVMLGQEIVIDSCILDYHDQPASGT